MIWRLFVFTGNGGVVAQEFHETMAQANERAMSYRERGHQTSVQQGSWSDDGTFVPE